MNVSRTFLPLILSAALTCISRAEDSRPPNLIWIMADDLGYGELGSYGQKVIRTPRLDRMAAEGLRFTRFYAGATVCAPSRSVLMTGQHHGRTRVRGNAGNENPMIQSLTEEDVTVAAMLREHGYRTALVGKWGLGDAKVAEAGLPGRQGFDHFYGFLNQKHAHNHFPDFLWRNDKRVRLENDLVAMGPDGAGYAEKPVQYVEDLFTEDALAWVAANKDEPFFLYWSMIVPHANNERTRALGDGAEVPDYGPYAGENWPDADKGQAAMITRMDGHAGRMLDRLDELGIANNTLVIFTSDNGPHDEAGHDLKRFNPSGPFSGIKRALTDGGIRVPMIARWPGRIEAGRVTGHAGHFADLMPTAAELAGAPAPAGTDGISLLPVLIGDMEKQKSHEFLYWEFHEGGFKQAALYQGRWKGIRSGGPDAPVRLFDTGKDPAEKDDVAMANPEITAKIGAYLKTARTESPDWQPVWKPAKP